MEIDRETLIKLLAVFVDVSESFQRELSLYRMLFVAACKAKGLNEQQIQDAVDRAREKSAARIRDAHQADYQNLLAKLPQLVDLLDSNRDEALRLLKEWTPKGPPH